MVYDARMASTRRAMKRILVNMLIDGGVAAIAAPLARYLADPKGGLLHPLWFVAGGAVTLLVAGLPFGLQRQYWRYSSVPDLLAIAAGSVASAALFSIGLVLTGFPIPTVTFPAIQALTLFVMLGAPRIVYRVSRSRRRARRGVGGAERVLLVGADEQAELFLRAVSRRSGSDDDEPVVDVDGLLAFASHQPGRRIHGRRILGRVDQAAEILAGLAAAGRTPQALVVTDPDFRGPPLASLIEVANRAGVAVRRAPRPTALSDASALDLRPVPLEDLLNRQQVPLDRIGMRRLVEGRRVLVTGAGGSIGSELCRQVASLGPARLVLLEQGEYALWRIERELAEEGAAVAGRDAVIADTRDARRLDEIFALYRPELVFHAAALKHVPIVEANPLEGLLTNAIGTRNVADAARRHGASVMVLISTDKAVNPSSLMGASKRLAEMYCQGLHVEATHGAGGTRFITVRFGNVLGSTGSVVPAFRRQLERGGPLTVTHPDVQRYFMTVSEAVGLVLQASVVGEAAGTTEARLLAEGGIFVLDMGVPVRIDDLARQMIRLAGLRPDEDVRIEYTGLRPGEKLFEELFHGKEKPEPTDHPGLLMARPRKPDAAIVRRALDELERICRDGDASAAIAIARRMVPEYVTPPEDVTPQEDVTPLSAIDRPEPLPARDDDTHRTTRKAAR